MKILEDGRDWRVTEPGSGERGEKNERLHLWLRSKAGDTSKGWYLH